MLIWELQLDYGARRKQIFSSYLIYLFLYILLIMAKTYINLNQIRKMKLLNDIEREWKSGLTYCLFILFFYSDIELNKLTQENTNVWHPSSQPNQHAGPKPLLWNDISVLYNICWIDQSICDTGITTKFITNLVNYIQRYLN